MKIAIDLSMVDSNKAGIGYYAFGLTQGLIKTDKENDYLIYTNDKNKLSELSFPANFSIVELDSSKINIKWIWRVYRDILKHKIDIFISPSNLLFGVLFSKTICVIHDIAQIKFPEFFNTKGRIIFKLLLDLVLAKQKVIVTNSNTTKEEVLEYSSKTKANIVEIGGGFNSWTKHEIDEEGLQKVKLKYSLPDKYLLSIATLEPRKNHINAIKGFAEFSKTNKDYYYVIVGKKGWFYDEIFKVAEELNCSDRVNFLGYVPEEDMPYVTDAASGFVNLSFYEGFAFTLMEAYSHGLPILASDIKVFREVMNPKALFINPFDVSRISEGFSELVNEKKYRPDLTFMEKYSWENVALRLIKTFNFFKQ